MKNPRPAYLAVIFILIVIASAAFGYLLSPVRTQIESITFATTVTQRDVTVGNDSIAGITGANVSIGTNLYDLGIIPSTNKIYIPAVLGNLSVIDGDTNKFEKIIATSGRPFLYMAANPTTNMLYVDTIGSCNSCPSYIAIVNGETDQEVGVINLGYFSDGLAVNPISNTLFAISANSESMYIVNGTTDSAIANISIPGGPIALAVNPQTNLAYVSVCGGENIELCEPFLYEINGTSHSIISSIPISLRADEIAVNAATNRVYLVTDHNFLISVNGTSLAQTTTVLSGFAIQCSAVDVNSASNEVYVGCGSDNVPNFFIVDGQSNNILNSFVDRGRITGVGYDSNNSMVYLVHQKGYVLAVRAK